MEINEKSLELVVSEKSLGKLTTNAIQIKEMVSAMLPKYDIANYNESNIDQAKKDKALLNNSAKVLNTKRIELEKEFMKPFDEFKDVISDTVKLIGEATTKIDTVVKQSEIKAKEQKRRDIIDYFDNLNFTLVPIEKWFDENWLNKTVTMKTAKSEIDAKIARFNEDMATIEAIGEDVDVLKSIYLDTLNLTTTIQYSNTLKENRKKIEDAKPKEPFRFPSGAAQVFEKPDEITEDAVWDDAKHFEVEKNVSVDEVPTAPEGSEETLERVMRVVATKAQLIALGDWMYDNGIYFEKLENVTA